MKRSLFQLPSLGSVCLPCRQKIARAHAFPPFRIPQKRLLTTTSHDLADTNPASSNTSATGSVADLSQSFTSRFSDLSNEPLIPESLMRKANPSLTDMPFIRPHHLHIYATRHNCHITLTAGNRDPIISVSSGNIGFKKAQRGSYDAAYQLGAYVMGMIKNQAMLDENYQGKGGQIRQLEVVLRNFGPGREAVSKILLGSEGRALRARIVRVMDGTRLKFGGTRGKKPRRLG
ncbi:hypothetical protein HO173_005197 [Letharia columbiana]|uniref:Translational machinery component n=1 Tax=Letharia columbiana TaxID=112416 RepID=A0A8H6L636_9LECA|nr:uncharacterized protein HO173_005197 [Letharia columbiana]KAF6236906.1 hypothetical protein HO173_005197 [Letharia columbiana]